MLTFMNFGLLGADLFHANIQTNRRTDMTKLTVAYHNSANAPKKADSQTYNN